MTVRSQLGQPPRIGDRLAEATGWTGSSGPTAAGQDETVPVGVRDRDAAAVPVRITRGDQGAASSNQAADDACIDVSIEVEHEQVFLGWRGWCFAVRVTDELQMPGSTWPSGHQQRMSAFRGRARPEQDVKAQAIDPEPLGSVEIAAGTRDAQVACWHRFHTPIIARRQARQGQTDRIASVIRIVVELLLTMGHDFTILAWTAAVREAYLGVYWA